MSSISKLSSSSKHKRTSNYHSKIEIVNESIFQSKLATILSSGPSNVQLVTDFDYTFSKYYSESHEKACSSYGLIENVVFYLAHPRFRTPRNRC